MGVIGQVLATFRVKGKQNKLSCVGSKSESFKYYDCSEGIFPIQELENNKGV